MKIKGLRAGAHSNVLSYRTSFRLFCQRAFGAICPTSAVIMNNDLLVVEIGGVADDGYSGASASLMISSAPAAAG